MQSEPKNNLRDVNEWQLILARIVDQAQTAQIHEAEEMYYCSTFG